MIGAFTVVLVWVVVARVYSGVVEAKLNDFSCLLFSIAEAAKDADCDI